MHPPNSGLLHPSVTTSLDRLAILTRGLFPHDRLHQLVWVEDNGSPTKYGRWLLSWKEPTMLWDVPILFSALFGKSVKDLSVLERLLDSPPAKFLGLGADVLLTGCFRGGWKKGNTLINLSGEEE